VPPLKRKRHFKQSSHSHKKSFLETELLELSFSRICRGSLKKNNFSFLETELLELSFSKYVEMYLPKRHSSRIWIINRQYISYFNIKLVYLAIILAKMNQYSIYKKTTDILNEQEPFEKNAKYCKVNLLSAPMFLWGVTSDLNRVAKFHWIHC
jgi:hypothetical protein